MYQEIVSASGMVKVKSDDYAPSITRIFFGISRYFHSKSHVQEFKI